MSDHKFTHHLTNLGYKIEDESDANFNGIGFDILTTNPKGQKHYFTVIDWQESNDVYSPKGEIHRKVDIIARIMRVTDSSIRFGIAVPNNNRYRRILNQKLQSITENVNGFLVGDNIEALEPAA